MYSLMHPVQFEITRPAASLQHLPIEVLQHIAIILATDSPTGPPKAIVPFLFTCRYIYSAIHSPQVYASIFCIQFDTAALHRRFTPGFINAYGLSEELKRRWKCLCRMRAASTAGEDVWGNQKRGVYSQAMLQEDMMTAYLMFLESDGRNATILLKWTRLPEYLSQYKRFVFAYAYEDPVLPCHSEESVLYVWLNWFCLDYRRSLVDILDLVAHLTAYVFGTFAYEGFHAPWPYPHLPLPPSLSLPSMPSVMPQAGQQATLTPANMLFTVDNSLRPRPVSTAFSRYFGRPLEIAAPLVSQAATLVFIACKSQYPFYVQDAPVLSVQDLLALIPSTGFTSASDFISGDPSVFSQRSYTAPYMQTRFATITDSRAYDDQFKRAITCRDPIMPGFVRELGVPRYQFTRGSITGQWDARCVIASLESYQRIMAGEIAINVLEEGTLPHDNHSWRIEEHYYNRRLTGFLPSSAGLSVSPPPPGPPINAHLPYSPSNLRFSTTWRGNGWMKGVVATTPIGSEVFYKTWDPSFVEDDDDEDNEGAVDIVITGHSIDRPQEIPVASPCSMPLGSTVYGTVRKWDGLITLRATSSSQVFGRDSWLWRGYLIGTGSNANFVGRYMTTHTDINHYAYEGVFTMVKREEQ